MADELLTDEERVTICSVLASWIAREMPKPSEDILAILKKLEGVDKQIVVRVLR